jgi:hypothetical protein
MDEKVNGEQEKRRKGNSFTIGSKERIRKLLRRTR